MCTQDFYLMASLVHPVCESIQINSMNKVILIIVMATLSTVTTGERMGPEMKSKIEAVDKRVCAASKEKQIKAEKCCMINEILVRCSTLCGM